MSSRKVMLEIITPRELFYAGEVEMLIVTTTDGEEGFMANHAWCVKLLAEKGRVKLRENRGDEMKIARIKGGHVDIKEHFVVYTDEAAWEE